MDTVRGEAYREEAMELLGSLETSLLQLEQNPEDIEVIGSVFRALHTIKGSGAMFGFESIAQFTHDVETVFDLVRNGTVQVTPELIGVTLAARDHIQLLLALSNTGDQDLRADGLAILDRLRRTVNVDLNHCLQSLDHEPQEAQASGSTHKATSNGPRSIWNIVIKPDPDMMENGASPALLFRDLRELGEASVYAHLDGIPELDRLQAGMCYVWWEIRLKTTATEDTIRDVFIFVEQSAKLTIERIAVEEPPVSGGSSQADTGVSVVGGSGVEKPLESRKPAGVPVNPAAVAATSLRVPAAKLDKLVNVVGELVTVQARLSGYASAKEDSELGLIAEEVERLTETLRESTMTIRMLPVGETFSRFRRLVRDLSGTLGKQVELVTEGNETELDKTVIEQLADPLVHLVRNAVDHGIEKPEVRLAAGKPAQGTLRLSATHAGAFVLIQLSDDGAGLNRPAIRQRAIERGIIAPDAQLSDAEIDGLIFAPGLSTVDKVSELSGRGVGMDVVQRSLDAIRGVLSVTSTPGQGTSISLRIPLTLAIIDGLLVEVGNEHFVVPLASVSECIEIVRPLESRGSRPSLVVVRGEQVPYIALRDRFELTGNPPPIEQVIISDTASGRFGFVVDRVIGDHHAVVKKLGQLYRHVDEISGATILGNGTLALVLDVARLAVAVVRENR